MSIFFSWCEAGYITKHPASASGSETHEGNRPCKFIDAHPLPHKFQSLDCAVQTLPYFPQGPVREGGNRVSLESE